MKLGLCLLGVISVKGGKDDYGWDDTPYSFPEGCVGKIRTDVETVNGCYNARRIHMSNLHDETCKGNEYKSHISFDDTELKTRENKYFGKDAFRLRTVQTTSNDCFMLGISNSCKDDKIVAKALDGGEVQTNLTDFVALIDKKRCQDPDEFLTEVLSFVYSRKPHDIPDPMTRLYQIKKSERLNKTPCSDDKFDKCKKSATSLIDLKDSCPLYKEDLEHATALCSYRLDTTLTGTAKKCSSQNPDLVIRKNPMEIDPKYQDKIWTDIWQLMDANQVVDPEALETYNHGKEPRWQTYWLQKIVFKNRKNPNKCQSLFYSNRLDDLEVKEDNCVNAKLDSPDFEKKPAKLVEEGGNVVAVFDQPGDWAHLQHVVFSSRGKSDKEACDFDFGGEFELVISEYRYP